MGKTIVIAGGTGLIGQQLVALLRAQSYEVRILTRTPQRPFEFKWDPAKGEMDESALTGTDFVINLAGAGIADRRWTASRKQVIIDSRVAAAKVLVAAISRLSVKPKAYISASAIGYYGNSGEQVMYEADTPVDQKFMVECCQKWEAGADAASVLGVRTVKLRIGIVLAAAGGALQEVVRPLYWGLGPYFGNGQSWWSWIHQIDVCRMIIWACEREEMVGVFNAVAPHPVRGLELLRSAAKAMQRNVLFFPVPGFALRLILGEMSAVVLNSNFVAANKITATGFQFLYPDLSSALGHIFEQNDVS